MKERSVVGGKIDRSQQVGMQPGVKITNCFIIEQVDSDP